MMTAIRGERAARSYDTFNYRCKVPRIQLAEGSVVEHKQESEETVTKKKKKTQAVLTKNRQNSNRVELGGGGNRSVEGNRLTKHECCSGKSLGTLVRGTLEGREDTAKQEVFEVRPHTRENLKPGADGIYGGHIKRKKEKNCQLLFRGKELKWVIRGHDVRFRTWEVKKEPN